LRPATLIGADLQALLDPVAAALAVAGSGRCIADPVSRAAGCPFNLLVGGPLCIFREDLRCDAEDEEYESAVLNWIYGYNGYESLGSGELVAYGAAFVALVTPALAVGARLVC